jgi:hypothetical protein
MTVPYAFANLSGNIALAKLDSNFNTPITIGNTSVLLGNTVTTLNNLTLANVTITSGTSNVTSANIGNLTLSNVLTAPNGGTGLVSAGNVGNVLTSTGSSWISSAIPSASNGAPTNASYVLVSASGSLSSGRVLTAGANVTITDNGAGNTIVIDSSGGGGGSGGLTLLATLTPTSGGASVSVTGLSSYKSIIGITNGITINSSSSLLSQISSDNGATYSSTFQISSSTALIAPRGYFQIYRTDASSSNKPYFSAFTVDTVTTVTGVINAVLVKPNGTTFTGVGNIYIYGLN